MRISVITGVAATVLTVSMAGCGGNLKPPTAKPASPKPATSTGSPTPARPGDYGKLMIRASDISAPVTFTAGAPVDNPNGQQGIATTFTDEDGSHVIKDTIRILADPPAATDALNAAKDAQGDAVKDPTTHPINIGTGGTMLTGQSPDKSKSVTIVLFTEGPAFVRLEFDGPSGALAPMEFLTDVGQKQDAAVKKGLGG